MSGKRFVYVVCPAGGPYKIGVAGDVKARIAALQCGNHQRLQGWHTVEVGEARYDRGVERRAHLTLDAHRLSGEWFGVPLDLAISAVNCALTEELPQPPGPRVSAPRPPPTSVRVPPAMRAQVADYAGRRMIPPHAAMIELVVSALDEAGL